jgi:hypothetical protein
MAGHLNFLATEKIPNQAVETETLKLEQSIFSGLSYGPTRLKFAE